MANLDGVDRSHYERFKIQPIVFVRGNDLPWDQGEIIKYVCRYKYKNGIEDLKKARHILDEMITTEEQERAKMQSQIQPMSATSSLGWLDPWPGRGLKDE
jgi:phage terminase Nu1 subunit (DNA packaging protein)